MLNRLLPDTLPDRRWWIRTLLINAGISLVVLAAIQPIPVRPGNAPVVREPAWDSPETRQLTVQACYDCHSTETHWPWYSYVAPISWITSYDVIEGREALNFSDWDYTPEAESNEPFAPKTLPERIADEINSGRMPPGTYRLMHPEARLSDAQKQALIEGLQRTIEEEQK